MATEPIRAVRFLVSGSVQGVYYRASASSEAQRLRLDGWARNLADGRVEVVARGEAAALDELAEWLWQGPARAVVEAVGVEVWTGAAITPGFCVR